MAEYDVSAVQDEEIEQLSGSRAELGDDASQITWRNCLDAASRIGAALGLDYDDVRDHFDTYGAWDRDEIDAWTDRELQALVIQEAAAKLRELEAMDASEPDTYDRNTEAGNLYLDLENEKAWLYLGA